MMNETNPRRLVFLVATLICLSMAAGLHHVAAQRQNRVEYGAVYDCGDGKAKFKVVSCKGNGKFDYCDVIYINEYAPNGIGSRQQIYRSLVLDDISAGCKVKGGTVAQPDENEQAEQPQREVPAANSRPVTGDRNQSAANRVTNSAVACPASDPDANGKTALEKNLRGVIRRAWEKTAGAGSDGAVTLTFQKFTVGAPRAWRPTLTDAYSQADPKKPIYPVRTTLTTCTDYRTAITTRKMERLYDCFTHKSGGIQCTQVGRTAGLMEDEKQYIQKQ